MCTSVDEAELRACLTGLYIGITLHKPVILETDYAFVVSLLAHDELDRSSLVDLKKEAIAITKLLPNFKLVKINRQTNEVAHQIMKEALNTENLVINYDVIIGFLFCTLPHLLLPLAHHLGYNVAKKDE